jgi:2-methylisocitrate lyase-like PEP mutase family enzyme
MTIMTRIPFALAVAAFVGSAAFTLPAFAAGTPVPCETMLKDVRAAMDKAKLSDADLTKVKDLEQQGLDRCKADDDAGADAFFADAMKIMGKA